MSAVPSLGELPPEAPLGRFVASSNQIRAEQTPRVKPKVFLPRPDEKAGELALSTFRLDGLTDEGVESLGREWAARHQGDPGRLKAACHLPARDYEALLLRLDPDNDPFRHVNVLGWPLGKDDQLDLANELCSLVEEQGTLREYR